jgi:hypothetical protein
MTQIPYLLLKVNIEELVIAKKSERTQFLYRNLVSYTFEIILIILQLRTI